VAKGAHEWIQPAGAMLTTDWTIALYLVPRGRRYLITAPASYRATHLDC